MRAFWTSCVNVTASAILVSGPVMADPADRVRTDADATTAQAAPCSAALKTEDVCQQAMSYQQRADKEEGAVRNALQQIADTKARQCREEPGSGATAATGVPCIRPDVAPQDIQTGQRLRVGTALGFVLGVLQSYRGGQVTVWDMPNGMTQVQLGEQISPQAALYVRGELGMGVFLVRAGLHVVGEWSPVRWFSIGSGLGYDGWGSEYSSWWAVSIPLVASIAFWRHDHNALRLSVDATGGVEPSTGLLGGRGGVTLGWVLD